MIGYAIRLSLSAKRREISLVSQRSHLGHLGPGRSGAFRSNTERENEKKIAYFDTVPYLLTKVLMLLTLFQLLIAPRPRPVDVRQGLLNKSSVAASVRRSGDSAHSHRFAEQVTSRLVIKYTRSHLTAQRVRLPVP